MTTAIHSDDTLERAKARIAKLQDTTARDLLTRALECYEPRNPDDFAKGASSGIVIAIQVASGGISMKSTVATAYRTLMADALIDAHLEVASLIASVEALPAIPTPS